MKWKTTPVTPDTSSSEEDDLVGTRGIDNTDPPHRNIQSNYNLRPRKVQETTHASTPELEGYNLCSHDKKPLPAVAKKSPRQPKPKSNPAKLGKVVFQSYGLRRPRPWGKKFNCILCGKKFDIQGALNKHIMKDHPTVHFMCSYCNKQFATANGHYKHEQSHGIFTHKCPYNNCHSSFQFPSGLKAHVKTHTGKGLYRCTVLFFYSDGTMVEGVLSCLRSCVNFGECLLSVP